jgi:hypothetical protein
MSQMKASEKSADASPWSGNLRVAGLTKGVDVELGNCYYCPEIKEPTFS